MHNIISVEFNGEEERVAYFQIVIGNAKKSSLVYNSDLECGGIISVGLKDPRITFLHQGNATIRSVRGRLHTGSSGGRAPSRQSRETNSRGCCFLLGRAFKVEFDCKMKYHFSGYCMR